MKKRIRKTGEIVTIISYNGGTRRNDILDSVSYIDSKGEEHPNEPLNFYWDFEIIHESNQQTDNLTNLLQEPQKINWEKVRIDAAIAAMQALCNSCHENIIRDIQNENDLERSNVISFLSVRIADALVQELKEKD